MRRRNVGVGDTHGGSGETCTNAATGTSSGCDIIADGALSTGGILGCSQFGHIRHLALGCAVPVFVGRRGQLRRQRDQELANIFGPF